MADTFDWDVIVRFATQGAKAAGADLVQFEKELDNATRAVGRFEKASASAAKAGPHRAVRQVLNAEEKAFLQQDRIYSDYLSKQEAHYKRQDELYNEYLAHQYRADNATSNLSGNLPRLRYALYDVSTSLTLAGAALAGFGTATVGVAVSMDRAFADVARTSELYLDETGRSTARLRDEFNELFSTLPASWADITDVGALAGQLNIAADSVAEFSRLVTMFAATTDVSVEQSATAFGRLAELLDVPASEFENLGSSILAVGVNSVATESQIISISTQITSIAASAGFSADQVFGLSSALASLGTQPELSRGVITRLFTNINNAITDGGDRLQLFGEAARMTGQEFARSWGQDAAGTLLRVLEGIGAQEGPAAIAALNDLGIVAARDVPTLLRLAQNSEVLADSLAIAAQGYADGSALSDQYGVIAETVAAKLSVLWNNVQLFVSALGGANSALGPVIDGATGLLRILTGLVSNPVAQWTALLVAGFSAIAGVLLITTGVFVRGLASVLAMRTAMSDLQIQSVAAAGGLRAFTLSLFGIEAGSARAATALKVLGRSTVVIAALTAALGVATLAWEGFESATKSAADRTREYFGDLAGLSDALAEDTRAFEEGASAIRVFTRELPSQTDSTTDAERAAAGFAAVLGEVESASRSASAEAKASALAFGETSVEYLRNQLRTSDAFAEAIRNPAFVEYWTTIGADVNEAIRIAADQGAAGVRDYFFRLEQAAIQGGAQIPQDLYFNLFGATEGNDAVRDRLDEVIQGFAGISGAAQDAANEITIFGSSSEDAAFAAAELAAEVDAAVSTLLDMESIVLGSENALFNLGSALARNGDDFSYFSEAGRENANVLMAAIKALAAETPGDAAATAANMKALFDFLVEGGHASASQLGVLSSVIASLPGSSKVAAANRDFTSFFGGLQSGAAKTAKATRSAGGTAQRAIREVREEVRTLVDYANDLRGVFSRAFDIRFGASSTLDKITTSFRDIREATEESARNIRSLKAEIQGLQSDLSIQRYFLGIAVEYGDVKRVEAIQANISKLQSEIAEKTADLTEEQSKNSKELTGNSKAAIANRATLEGLVQQYQAHVVALASSGLGQQELARRTEQLRQDFIRQATQLGFSRSEIERYSRALGDLTRIVGEVPRNVTIAANADPAVQALNEYRAAADRANSSLSSLRNNSTQPIPLNVDYAKAGRAARLRALILSYEGMIARETPGSGNFRTFTTALKYYADLLASGNYASGGFTGRGGRLEPAGIVHRGEYVIPKHQVNQRTGLPYADAMGRLQRGASGPGYANGGYVRGGGSVYDGHISSFGPMAQQQLQQALQQIVLLDGQRVATSSAAQYAQSTAHGAY